MPNTHEQNSSPCVSTTQQVTELLEVGAPPEGIRVNETTVTQIATAACLSYPREQMQFEILYVYLYMMFSAYSSNNPIQVTHTSLEHHTLQRGHD